MKKRHVLSLLSVCWMGAMGQPAAAVEIVGPPISVSLTVPEVILLDFPNGGSTEIELEIRGDCDTISGICLLGVATIDFRLIGNTDVTVQAAPEAGSRSVFNNRNLGRFSYLTDPEADVPPLYYDLSFEIIDAGLGEAGFTFEDVQSPDLVPINDLTLTQHQWQRSADLREGVKLGRIYVQPLFDGGVSVEDLNLAVPGLYTANLELVVTTR